MNTLSLQILRTQPLSPSLSPKMSSHPAVASPEKVVKALMKFIGHEDAPGRPNAKLVHQRSERGCGKTIKFSAKSGFTNPYQHLRSCYARGKPGSEQDTTINCLFQKALDEQAKAGGMILSHFNVDAMFELDNAIYSYIRLIVLCNMPVDIIENSVFRSVSRFEAHIRRRTLVNVMLSLVELVEEKIAIERAGSTGAVMFDGWTNFSTHYVAVYALYCTKSLCALKELRKNAPLLAVHY